MRKIIILITVIMCLVLPFQLEARRFARWYTNMGVFTAEIRNEIMPITGDNFIDLTVSNFYDGLHFHRVISGFVIQDGDPLGTGYGGPGYTIPDEYSPLLLHDSAGVLAMAKTSQPNSAGSQYYITLAPTPNLNGNYAVFGKVIQGLDVVLNIGQVETDTNDHPISEVTIDSLRMLGLEVGDISPTESDLDLMSNINYQFSVVAFDVNLFVDADFQWFINDVEQIGADQSVFNTVFESGDYTIKCLASNSEISFATIWQASVAPSHESNNTITPNSLQILNAYPNPFKENVTLKYEIKRSENIQIKVFDIKGRLVNESLYNYAKQGENYWSWDGRNNDNIKVPSGIYLFEVSSSTDKCLSKVILLK